MPAHAGCFQMIAVLGIYGALRSKGLTSLALALESLMLISYLIMAFSAFAHVRKASEMMLVSWKQKQQSKYERTVLRSCPPLQIPVGSFYFCDRGMLVTMLQRIFENVVNLLVMF
ncbi:unnamed protein product [Allacma fusca]|nr:unnamed protein product [Allacma fusca]